MRNARVGFFTSKQAITRRRRGCVQTGMRDKENAPSQRGAMDDA
jgi:hypothetical protein